MIIMRIRITSITTPNVAEKIRNITVYLEDFLRPILAPKDYGGEVDQFCVIFLAFEVDPSSEETQAYYRGHNRSGRYKDFITGEVVRHVTIAIPVSIEQVLSTSRDELRGVLEDLLMKELASPSYKFPKKFERERLFSDLTDLLARS